MRWLLLVLVLLALVGFFLLKRRNRSQPEGAEALPYVLGDALFTPAERSFLGVLDQAVGADFRVFGKVRVADIVAVTKGTPKPLWQRAFNQISAKHFDFVLCSPNDLKPVCVIELNDQSHAKENRQGRDNFLERVCTAAGIPLIFFPAKSTYTLAEICASIANAMGAKIEPSDVTAPTVLGEVNVSAIKQDFAIVQEIDLGPDCPRCSSQMVRRMAKSGENAGKEFWGCTKFPACRGMVLS